MVEIKNITGSDVVITYDLDNSEAITDNVLLDIDNVTSLNYRQGISNIVALILKGDIEIYEDSVFKDKGGHVLLTKRYHTLFNKY
tara:strand:- start:33 stop:287 length:255 start_codon:yes stop_codon:yes gene_type:complete